MAWYQETGPEGQIVLSSRIRLARNVRDKSFPNALSPKQQAELNREIRELFLGLNAEMPQLYLDVRLDELGAIERRALVEKRLISHDLAEAQHAVEALIRRDECVSIMLGEEDHIRIQAMRAGLQLETAYDEAEKLAILLEELLPIAYDEQLGFLTACPTNLGTGMRASLMVHLPALTATGQMEEIGKRLAERGLTIRGALGEGTKAEGRLYQISNQITLGLTEAELIRDLKQAVESVIRLERKQGAALLAKRHGQLEDRIYRSFALLRSARRMGSAEAEQRISDIRWGMSLGLLPDGKVAEVNALAAGIGVAEIQKAHGQSLDAEERDRLRAETLRKGIRRIFSEFDA